MVQVSTASANDSIDMSNPLLVDFGAFLSASSSHFSWWTTNSSTPYADVSINGTGFIRSGSGNERELTGGTITNISIDKDNDNGSETAGDLTITDTGALIASNIDKDDPQSFWNEVLKGNDSFDLSGLSQFRVGLSLNVIFGDDLYAQLGTDSGGNDTMLGGNNYFDLIGDVRSLSGSATYNGGDDTIRSGLTEKDAILVGDAWTVSALGSTRVTATLNGGNDVLDSSQNSRSSAVVGDAYNQAAGTVNGGDDIITPSKLAPLTSGDVHFFQGGNLNGGDDRITSGGGGQDWIGGDVFRRGGTSGTIVGGNDTIFGGAGNDRLYGEVAAGDGPNGSVVAGDNSLSQVSGGSDRIVGGTGTDTISGQTNGDWLDGGFDNDRMAGGSGPDIFIFAPGADDDRIVDFSDVGGASDDRIDVRAYNFTSANQIGKIVDGADLILDFGGSDTVRLVGYRGDHLPADINNDFIL
jgi:Ca2+-binding RTX toxin-like protein